MVCENKCEEEEGEEEQEQESDVIRELVSRNASRLPRNHPGGSTNTKVWRWVVLLETMR